MVSVRPYKGRKAWCYDSKRKKQNKWHRENEIVERMLRDTTGDVYDVPCGTGRFFSALKKLNRKFVGADASDQMLEIARKKYPDATLEIRTAQEKVPSRFKTILCVRLLHLITLKDMARVFSAWREAKHVILTVQIRDEPRSTADVQTHQSSKFRDIVRREGWTVAEEIKITSAGWHVMRLTRSK